MQLNEIVDIDRLRRIVIKWRNELMPELKAEGYTRCTITLEPQGALVKLATRMRRSARAGTR